MNNSKIPKPFDKPELEKIILSGDYQSLTADDQADDSAYDPSSCETIIETKLNFEALTEYLSNKYGTCEKPQFHLKHINEILNDSRSDYLIKTNKSEYFKVLTHFTILSKTKRGWFNLIIPHKTRKTEPSLTDNPTQGRSKSNEKTLNDALIRCFYYRLFEGMSADDKQRYQILVPNEKSPSSFDDLLHRLDKSIQNYFELIYENIESYEIFDNEDDSAVQIIRCKLVDESILQTRKLIDYCLKTDSSEGYKTDTLRANLIKFATINRAINDIDAILDLQQDAIKAIYLLPENMEQLIHIHDESQITSTIADLFFTEVNNLPKDLIHCAKLVCKMHILNSIPYQGTKESIAEHSKFHLHPASIAVSSALLYQSVYTEEALDQGIRGESNPYIKVYKTLSDFSTRIKSTDELTKDTLVKLDFSLPLFKYLTTRYSISTFSVDASIPFVNSARESLYIKAEKFKLQQEAYELLKDMSLEDAEKYINLLSAIVNSNIKASITNDQSSTKYK